MHSSLSRAALAAVTVLVCTSCPPPIQVPPCCGDLQSHPPRPVRVNAQIAARTTQVPFELQGCGVNGEEITSITLTATMAGCSRIPGGARIVFPTLEIEFSTSGANCHPGQAPLDHRLVSLRNVVYSADLQTFAGSACLRSSSVEPGYTFESHDAGYANLFAIPGSRTLRPILDAYAFAWAISQPMTCPPTLPPGPLFPPTTRCP